jgi:hypothetical protein
MKVYEKCFVGLSYISKEAWTISQINDSVRSDKLKGFSFGKRILCSEARVAYQCFDSG